MSIWPLPFEFHQGSKSIFFADVPLVYKRAIVLIDSGVSWFWTLVKEVKPCSQAAADRFSSREGFVHDAYGRIKSQIRSTSFVPNKFHARGEFFEPDKDSKRTYLNSLTIEEYQMSDTGPSDEAYTLAISEGGDVVIRSVSYRGSLWALRSLQQLFYAHSDPSLGPYASCVPVSIRDCPVFSHRGLHLDISRNQILPDDILQTIEALSLNKFNRLHIHATDSQSWPLEVPALPELAVRGAYDKRQIWSTWDLQKVQEFGYVRGIEVYIEIDLPSHAGAISHAYPELITGYNAQPWSRYALEPPTGQLKLNSPDVSKFMSTLLTDILPRTSEFSSHFHFGGDELNREIYTLDSTVGSSSTDVIRPLLQKFFDHALSLATPYRQTPVLYEDVLLEWDLEFPKSTIFQSWKSHESFTAILSKGHRALFGPSSHWYLDQGYGSWLDPDPSNPDSSVKPPYLDWAAPYKNWRQIYSYDPFHNVT